MTEKYQVIYSPEAKDDLKSIYYYIAFNLHEQQTGKNQVNKIRKAIRSLDTFPQRFAKVDWEPWASLEMHRVTVGNYVVYYLIDTKLCTVTVNRIFYGGRNVENIIKSEDT